MRRWAHRARGVHGAGNLRYSGVRRPDAPLPRQYSSSRNPGSFHAGVGELVRLRGDHALDDVDLLPHEEHVGDLDLLAPGPEGADVDVPGAEPEHPVAEDVVAVLLQDHV